MTFVQVNIMQISVIRNIENCCLLAWCVCLTLYLKHGTKKNKKKLTEKYKICSVYTHKRNNLSLMPTDSQG